LTCSIERRKISDEDSKIIGGSKAFLHLPQCDAMREIRKSRYIFSGHRLLYLFNTMNLFVLRALRTLQLFLLYNFCCCFFSVQFSSSSSLFSFPSGVYRPNHLLKYKDFFKTHKNHQPLLRMKKTGANLYRRENLYMKTVEEILL
jgi:hypothetical protein